MSAKVNGARPMLCGRETMSRHTRHGAPFAMPLAITR
jgi:hypothetical protein